MLLICLFLCKFISTLAKEIEYFKEEYTAQFEICCHYFVVSGVRVMFEGVPRSNTSNQITHCSSCSPWIGT